MPLLTLLRPRGTADAPTFDPPVPAVGSVPIIRPTLRVRLSTLSGLVFDLSGRCRMVTTVRGRSSRTAYAADPQTMTLAFDDLDGMLDPDNAGSQLWGLLAPRGPAVITVEHLFEGGHRPVGTGVIDSLERRWGEAGAWSESVMTTIDQGSRLAQMVPPATLLLPAETAPQRVSRLARTASRANYGFEPFSPLLGSVVSVGYGNRLLPAEQADGKTTLWEYMQQAAQADDGLVYFTASGGLKYVSGIERDTRPVVWRFGDDPAAGHIEVATDLTYRLSSDVLMQEVAYSTRDGAWTVAASPLGDSSVNDNTGTALSLNGEAAVAARARRDSRRFSVPRRAVETVTLDALAAYRDLAPNSPYRCAVGVSVWDRVQLSRQALRGGNNLVGEYHVESISHQIEAGRQWQTTLRLAAAEPVPDYWHLGSGRLGNSTYLTW